MPCMCWPSVTRRRQGIERHQPGIARHDHGKTEKKVAPPVLTGDRAGEWSISVTGNWRLTFKIEDGAIEELNLEDYH